MDHLNLPSLRRILLHTRRRGGKPPVIIVPKNVTDLVRELGFSEVRSLDWWQSTNIAGIDITATPAQHWGARVLTDTHRGFGGYVLRNSSHSVYHAGDTGYFPGLTEIGQRLSPQIALLPIGAYRPAGVPSVHMTPEDAVRAFLDLRAQRLIPMHYGTFSLTDEPIDEPLQRFTAAAKQAGIMSDVDTLHEGETRIYPSRCTEDVGKSPEANPQGDIVPITHSNPV